MYNYELYHLKISSNIAIAGLNPTDLSSESYDIKIVANMIENNLLLEDENKLQVDKNNFYLSIKNVAIYQIKDDSTINIKYHSSASSEEISLYLLGSCLGIILFKKGFFPLHASSIYLPNKGTIFFAGASGAGKSTILNAFLKKGYQMVSDDISAFKINNEVSVLPSFPRTKIWQDSANKLNINTLTLPRIHRDVDKYSYTVENSQFYNRVSKPYALYEINKYAGEKVYLDEIKSFSKIELIHRNTYRVEYIESLKISKEHFKQINSLAKQIKVKKIYRPIEKNSIDEIVDLIENDLSV